MLRMLWLMASPQRFAVDLSAHKIFKNYNAA